MTWSTVRNTTLAGVCGLLGAYTLVELILAKGDIHCAVLGLIVVTTKGLEHLIKQH